MGKYLRDISIHTNIQELPNGKNQRDFNITAHNVQYLFFYQIPRKFEFVGITKLNISIINYSISDSRLSSFIGGIVEYRYPDFDFEKYFKLSRREQNLEILNILRITIKDIGKDALDKQKILLKITDLILDNNFQLIKEVKKLSKRTRDKKYFASVSVKVDGDGQNAFIDIVDRYGEILIHDHLLANIVYEFWTYLYSSKWDKNSFKIFDRNGNVFKQYELKV